MAADQKPYSLQHIFNRSFNEETQQLMVLLLGQDGQGIQMLNADNLAIKVTVSGSITYVGKAAPGSDQASAVWQCMKIDETSGTVITWANGNANFDNIATDLTALTYS